MHFLYIYILADMEFNTLLLILKISNLRDSVIIFNNLKQHILLIKSLFIKSTVVY